MATHMVHDFTGSVLRFYDAAGALLAELRYHPSERSRGDFRGRSVAAGTGVRWGLSCQDGSLVLGSCDESFGYRIHTSIAAWYVDKMVQAASEQDRGRESAPKAGDRLLVLGKTSHVPTMTHEEAEARMGMRIPRAAPVAVYDVATGKRVHVFNHLYLVPTLRLQADGWHVVNLFPSATPIQDVSRIIVVRGK